MADISLARISGPRAVLIRLPQRADVDVLEHTDRAGPGELYTVDAYLTQSAAERLRQEGCTVEILADADAVRARLDKARSQTWPARPVALVVVRGSGDLLSDLPGRFGVDPPLYSVRSLGDGSWEISTEADVNTIAALRAAGLTVEVLEEPSVLARRRGEG
jgi:hypothetical protein